MNKYITWDEIKRQENEATQPKPLELTKRQCEACQGYIDGLTREQIAQKMEITTGTLDATLHAARTSVKAANKAHFFYLIGKNGFKPVDKRLFENRNK